MLRPPVTVPVVFVHNLLAGLRLRGLDAGQSLARARISTILLDEPGARVTATQYSDLCLDLIETFGDEGVGFFSRPVRRGSLILVMRSVIGARTFETAMRRLCHACNLVQDDVKFELAWRGRHVGICLDIPPQFVPERIFVHEMLLRALLRQISWLHGGRLGGLEFELALARPPYAHELEKILPGMLRFDMPRTALWFEAPGLMQPLRQDQATLREFVKGFLITVIAPQRGSLPISLRVRSCLLQARPSWLSLVEAAHALNIAPSTLQRHLATEGTTFQVLKDELRRDLAIQRLNSSNVPLAALALELGFSDSAVFQRAFKTWTGSAPGAYRCLHKSKSDLVVPLVSSSSTTGHTDRTC